MKINPLLLKRPHRERETRTFVEPGVNGSEPIEFELTFWKPNAADLMAATEISKRLVEDFITGSEIRPAGPFPDPDVIPTESYFMLCALGEVCQPSDLPDRYTALDFALLLPKLPTAGLQIQRWINQKMGPEAASLGEPSREPTASSSAPSSP